MTDTLTSLFKAGASPEQIAAHLDRLDEETRLAEVRAFPASLQSKLYDASGQRPCAVKDFVPEADTKTCYSGRNSSPAFSNFAKVFWRRADTGEVLGYNEQFWRAFSGPGYFTAFDQGSEVIFDYTKLPTSPPDQWPKIEPNRGLIASAAFGGMIDHNRWVSSNTVVGRAYKNGKLFAHYLITRTSAPR